MTRSSHPSEATLRRMAEREQRDALRDEERPNKTMREGFASAAAEIDYQIGLGSSIARELREAREAKKNG